MGMPFAPKVQRYLRRGSYAWNKVGSWWPSLDRRGWVVMVAWLPIVVVVEPFRDTTHLVEENEAAQADRANAMISSGRRRIIFRVSHRIEQGQTSLREQRMPASTAQHTPS